MQNSIHQFTINNLEETETIDLSAYKGKKLLIVNVASKCGYTPQYAGLQQLYEQYGDQLEIIGFPCNQFLFQEPGSAEDIRTFCSSKYNVTFPITKKVAVKGSKQHEIYKWLTSKRHNGIDNYKVKWNFNKFLLDEEGRLIAYFPSAVKPMSDTLTAMLK